ncbi:MAG: SPFH domain-containing protein [Acetivibrionales bacterium]|jgi:flotillin|nr:SPFH domain-containing protein [Bacillota bacterium]NLP07379.1 flotillin family protein [Clostridiaceae bacterium]HOA54808.1 SPFH domain-containing protein [Clostridiales bacterium]HQD31113.1 SPFH domain-containing protein [Clostridiales bacterium]
MGYLIPVLIALALVVVIFILISVFVGRYVKVGPDEALIVSGRKKRLPNGQVVGFRIVKGGATFVWPVLEKAKTISLRIMPLDVNSSAYTSQGVQVNVDGVAQVKIDSTHEAIATAAEQFLSLKEEEIRRIATQTLEGHLRSIVGNLTVEEIMANRDAFAQKVQELAASDLANMGLRIISFTIREIADKNGYLESLGKAQIARVQRDAVIGQAEAKRDADIKSAEAMQAGQTAKYLAETRVAEANRDKEMKMSEYQASINEKKAEADLAYDKKKYVLQQEVEKEAMQVEIVKKQKEIELQEQEALRKEQELDAMIRKPAEAEKYRTELSAEADKVRKSKEAEAQSFAIKAEGAAKAEAIKAAGLAEAEVIKAKGEAEAEALARKAEAYKQFNDAAIAQMVIEKLPEIAAAIAQPLAKTEKIVMIGESGASKITRDITGVMAQLPETIKGLTGIDLTNILKNYADPKAGPADEEKEQ